MLLSGGGSANWIAPAEGVSFAQKQQVTRALLRSGAPIGEVNTVRKHLSRIKGGRLARAGQRAEIVTLAISDVPHDDPSAIASGPTVPDPTTLADARAIVAKYGLEVDDADPPRARRSRQRKLQAGRCRLCARAVRTDRAAEGLARRRDQGGAASAGYAIIDLGADLEGEAREVAADHARLALKARAEGKRVAILSGGELTVTVRGNGRGGPNQEYALALAGLLKDTSGISALAGDTDGADGGAGSATDPAGAMIDPATFAKMKSLGLDPKAYLDNNDATAFFAATGDLLLTGPTLTNVNDVRVILVDGCATVSRTRCSVLHAAPQSRDPVGRSRWTPDLQRTAPRCAASGARPRSKLLGNLGQHRQQRGAVGGTEQFVEARFVLGGDQLLRPRQHRAALVGQNQDDGSGDRWSNASARRGRGFRGHRASPRNSAGGCRACWRFRSGCGRDSGRAAAAPKTAPASVAAARRSAENPRRFSAARA